MFVGAEKGLIRKSLDVFSNEKTSDDGYWGTFFQRKNAERLLFFFFGFQLSASGQNILSAGNPYRCRKTSFFQLP